MPNGSTGQIFAFSTDNLNHYSVEEKGEKKYFVEGHVTTGDLDLVNDIVSKSCMDDIAKQFDSRTIKLDLEHESFRGSTPLEREVNKTRIPLGKSIKSVRDVKGNLITWELNKDYKKFDTLGNQIMDFKEAWRHIENGYYDAFSIAYVPVNATRQTVQNQKVRLLDKVNILNVALTGNPVNPEAKMSQVFAKSLDYLDNIEKKGENTMDATEEQRKLAEQKAKEQKAEDDKKKEEEEEAKKKEAEKKAEDDKKKEEEEEAKKKESEQKALEAKNVEVKAMTELKSVVEVLQKEVAEMKAIMSKAIPKGHGAEDKSNVEQKSQNQNGFSPLQYIQ